MIGLDLLLSEVIKNFITQGAKKYEVGEQLQTSRLVLAERLLREMRFNLEIIGEFKKEKKDFLQEIDVRVVEGIFSQPLPITILFPDSIPEELLEKLAGENKKYHIWTAAILSEADLIERIWLRINVAKSRHRNQSPSGDVQYLEKLMLCLKDCLLRRVSNPP